MFGLCVAPGFLPSRDELDELKPDFLRSILYDISDLDALEELAIPLFLTLNNQCAQVGFDWAGWVDTLLEIERRTVNVFAIGCGNEFDLYNSANPDDVPPEFAAMLIRTARETLRQIEVVATSVAGPNWVEYLRRMHEASESAAHWYDCHFYGQRPDGWGQDGWGFGNLTDAIRTAESIVGSGNVGLSEYGVKIDDAGGEAQVASFLKAAHDSTYNQNLPFVSWFAYRDQVGAPNERGGAAFGLMAEDGRKRPAWHAYKECQASLDSEQTPEVKPIVKENIVDIERWRGVIGSGLLDMMQEDNTEPAQRASTWLPLGVTPSDIEECYGTNGTRYTWLLRTNKGFRFPADR
jgi:hypothetical protein